MRCVNSPAVLNSLEAKIVETIPADVRHVLIINAGDGRLARALREKRGDAVVTSVVTIQPGMLGLVDDIAGRTDKPWDLAWHEAQVAAHGAYDAVVLYQLHEFWRGELDRIRRVLRLAKPGATVWTSFFNAQSNRMIGRFVPPVQLGFSTLADPTRCIPNIDFASWLDLAGRVGGGITELWGMLDQNAQEFCQKPPAQPVQWEIRGTKVKVGTVADAFLWGAAAVAVAFQLRGGPAVTGTPRASFSPYNANLMQALAMPYPDFQMREGVRAAAQFEADGWRQAPAQKVGQLAKFLLEQAGDAEQPKRVLLVGSGWGRDLLILKAERPKWDWVGYERDSELRDMGQDLLAAAGVTAVGAADSGALPFEDRSFDLVVSLGHFSGLYEPAARELAKEVRRVARGSILHIEDGRGPDQAMQLKTYSLKGVYAEAGVDAAVQPVLANGNPTGMYLLKANAPA